MRTSIISNCSDCGFSISNMWTIPPFSSRHELLVHCTCYCQDIGKLDVDKFMKTLLQDKHCGTYWVLQKHYSIGYAMLRWMNFLIFIEMPNGEWMQLFVWHFFIALAYQQLACRLPYFVLNQTNWFNYVWQIHLQIKTNKNPVKKYYWTGLV